MDKEKARRAIELFDYMLSRFNAIYDNTQSNADSIYKKDYYYSMEKLNYMARVLESDFNGSFKEFVDTINMDNMKEALTMEELENIELTA